MTAKTWSVEEKLADLIARLHAKFRVDKALLFGSTARGERLQESDVDLIVVSEGFGSMSVPERQGAVQKEWNHPEELQALTYTPGEFSEVSKRLTMKEALSNAVDISPLNGMRLCPKCGRKGSVQTKIVRNSTGRSYPFLYFAHYSKGKLDWCYLGPPRRYGGYPLNISPRSPPLGQRTGSR